MSNSHATRAIPCVSYADAHAAIAWLQRALGAHVEQVHDGPDDTVAHAELWFGDACVMAGSLQHGTLPPRTPGTGVVYVVLAEPAAVDALHDRAAAVGATIVITLRDTDYGSRDFACADPEGNFWCFGTYAPTRAARAETQATAAVSADA